ncbi:MAG: glycosyltransferase [Verrucomicrobiota bacterium]
MVSIILPARNAAATLAAAVESLRAQSLDDWELILIDHRPSDTTGEIIAGFAAKDRRIRPHACHGTFVEALNQAHRAATRPLHARMDADDVAHPERLAMQVAFLERHPEIAAVGTDVAISKLGEQGERREADLGYQHYAAWINSLKTPAAISQERFIDSPVANPTAMIREQAFHSIGGYRESTWAEDYDFWLRLIESGQAIGKVDSVLLEWIDHPKRTTRTEERYSQQQFQAAKAHYLARLLKRAATSSVAICGAGPIGKQCAKLLRSESIDVVSFFEVNPRQIGSTWEGIPILDNEQINDYCGATTLLSAVGQRGARGRIRKLVTEAGFTEGEDFYCLA